MCLCLFSVLLKCVVAICKCNFLVADDDDVIHTFVAVVFSLFNFFLLLLHVYRTKGISNGRDFFHVCA